MPLTESGCIWLSVCFVAEEELWSLQPRLPFLVEQSRTGEQKSPVMVLSGSVCKFIHMDRDVWSTAGRRRGAVLQDGPDPCADPALARGRS